MVVAYHPFMDARIFKKEAKSLQKKGYDVSMIVPRKQGLLFDIDGTPFKNQFKNKVFTHEGIKVITYHAEHTKHALGQVLSDEKVWESQGFNNALTQLAIQENADIYHTHEYLSLYAGIGIKRLMKKRKGKDVKLIYDSHELTPDPLNPRYSEEKRNILKAKLLLMLDEVDYIITVSDAIKSWYVSHKPSVPVEIIYNSPPLAKQVTSKTYRHSGFTMVYEGNIDEKKGSQAKIIEMTDRCSQAFDFQFKIIGGNRFGDKFDIPKHLQHAINLTGWVDFHTIPHHMKDADVGWIDLGDVKQSLNRAYSLPNKFFSYLNNGLPVLVNKCHEMERFINQHQCGYVIDKTEATAKDFAGAVRYLHDNKDQLIKMSHNARQIMENIYSWEKMEERLFHVYQQLYK